ncbi:MAG TPA: S4 domain-containing protein, partial [Spirochaetota bacterium]|nr:S4 domain-containing protein [Spirochaetota bacterium]
MEDKIIVTVPGEYHLERIDRFLAANLEEDLSRSLIQRYIRENLITVNGEAVRANYKVKTDDEILITFPQLPEGQIEPSPENIPLDIVYQDEHIVVINKQPGLVVHP